MHRSLKTKSLLKAIPELVLMWKMWIFIAVSFFFASSACWADSPLVTEDADVLEKGKCEFESLAGRQRHPKETVASAQIGCGFGYHSELSVAGSREISSDPDMDYLMVNGKTAFQDLTQNQAGIAIAYTLLSGKEKGHDLNYVSTEIKGVITIPYQNWLLHANAGILHWHAHASRATWGVAAERINVMNSIDLAAEIFGDSKSNPWVQVGMRWNAIPDFMIFNIACGVQANRDHTQLATVGVKVVFK